MSNHSIDDYFKMYETQNHFYQSDGHTTLTSLKSSATNGTTVGNHRLTTTPTTTQHQKWVESGPASRELHNDPFLSREQFVTHAGVRAQSSARNLNDPRPRSLCVTLWYLLVIATLAVISSAAIYILWNDYSRVGTFIVETTKFSPLENFEFPVVTICNKSPLNVYQNPYANPFSTQQTDSLISAIRNASDGSSNFSALNNIAVYNEDYFYASYSKKFAYQHRTKLQQFFFSCRFYNAPYQCDLLFKPVYVPLKGICYRSQFSKAWPIEIGPFLGLDIHFYFEKNRVLDNEDSPLFGRGALVIIGDHQGSENAIPINVGTSTSLSAREIQYTQNESYKSHQCYHATETPFSYLQASTVTNDEVKLGYSIEMCRNLCNNDVWKKAFGCYLHAGYYSLSDEECMDDTAQRKLTIQAMVGGHSNLTKKLRKDGKACSKQCQPLCDYKKYDYTQMTSPMKVSTNYVNNLIKRNTVTKEGKDWMERETESKHSRPTELQKNLAHLKVFVDSSNRKKTVSFQPVSTTPRFFADICAIMALALAIFYTLALFRSTNFTSQSDELQRI
ncbi:uncharacterized protein LOC134850390 [Symsagittifera roscoffensis]|uniref:uncharacterized protein LOC134850390 n=1 Tax=Symsagittifera roscoffensis TaxID=84072 RepID=UPI00307B1BD4